MKQNLTEELQDLNEELNDQRQVQQNLTDEVHKLNEELKKSDTVRQQIKQYLTEQIQDLNIELKNNDAIQQEIKQNMTWELHGLSEELKRNNAVQQQIKKNLTEELQDLNEERKEQQKIQQNLTKEVYKLNKKLKINDAVQLQIKQNLTEELWEGDKLPPTLYIQADNYWRENKNRYVLSFCELLVAKDIFKEVHLSFLYVGHTHEDVDAAFSRISEKLRITDIATFEELLHVLPKAEALQNLYDVKAWLDPHLSECSQQTRPLHYKFEAGDAGVRTSFKGNHVDDWIALDGKFLPAIPRGQPRKLKPDFQRIDVDRNMKQVRAIQHMFKTPTEIHAWWEEFYLNMNKETTDSQWILDRLPKQSTRSTPTVQAEPLPEVISHMLDKEVRVPEVRIRKKPQSSDTGRGSKKLKKPAEKQKSGKAKGKRHRRYMYISKVTITTLCLLEGDLKKHIENFIQNVFFLYMQILYCWKEWFQLLLLAGNLVLMKLIIDIWNNIVAVHMGLFPAMVSVVTILSASHFYAPKIGDVEEAYWFGPVHLSVRL